jgi:hypothetical protein
MIVMWAPLSPAGVRDPWANSATGYPCCFWSQDRAGFGADSATRTAVGVT